MRECPIISTENYKAIHITYGKQTCIMPSAAELPLVACASKRAPTRWHEFCSFLSAQKGENEIELMRELPIINTEKFRASPPKKQVSDCLRRKQPHSMSPCGNGIQKLLLVLPIVCKHAVENFFTYISYFSVIFLVVSGILRIFA